MRAKERKGTIQDTDTKKSQTAKKKSMNVTVNIIRGYIESFSRA